MSNPNPYYEMASEIMNKASDHLSTGILTKIGLILTSLVAPVAAVLITLLVLVFVDFATTVAAAKKFDFIKKRVLFVNMIKKMIIFSIVVILGHYVQIYLLGDEVKLNVLVTSFLALIEFRQILSNLDIISGTGIFQPLLDRIKFLNRSEQNRNDQ